MKAKIIAALLLTAAIAAPAYAGYGGGFRGGCGGPGPRPEMNLTEEEKAQHYEMRKLHDEIFEALDKETPDKDKAKSLFEREQDLREKMMKSDFERCLNDDKAKSDRICFLCGGRGRHGGKNDPWKDLREELSKESPDKVRANELFTKALKERRTNEEKRFDEILKDPAKFCRGRGERPGPGRMHRGPSGEGDRPEPPMKLTAEERTRHNEIRKIHEEIVDALGKDTPDKSKAKSLFEREEKLREEMMKSRFENCLENHGKNGHKCFLCDGRAPRSGRSDVWSELRGEMSKENPDKTRAAELFNNAVKKFRAEAKKRFEEILKDPAKFCRKGKDGRVRHGRECPARGEN